MTIMFEKIGETNKGDESSRDVDATSRSWIRGILLAKKAECDFSQKGQNVSHVSSGVERVSVG